MYYLDNNLVGLKRIFDQNGRSGSLRLDLNENPGGLDEGFVRKTLSKVTPEFIAQYPEDAELYDVLADHLSVSRENLVLTNGSAEAIRYVIQAFTSPRGRIVGVVPSYFMFQVYSQMYGRDFIPVSYTEDLEMPVERILREVTPETQLLILLNPNNPMGNVYSEDDMERLIAACNENEVTVLIDEAYHYFWPKTFLEYALSNHRVFITRTFSKLFSMAGLRLGYIVGSADNIEYVRRLTTPHNTNAIAMLFAKEILTTEGMLENLEARFKEGRSWLVAKLDELGYRHKGEAGNFIFIEPKSNADRVVELMEEKARIRIKSYKGVGDLGDCLRVSIGEKKYMQRFIEALQQFDR